MGPHLWRDFSETSIRVSPVTGKPVHKGNIKVAERNQVSKYASCSGQKPAGAKEVGPVQQANEPSQPSAAMGVHVAQGDVADVSTAKLKVGFRFPTWMLCLRPATEDGKH